MASQWGGKGTILVRINSGTRAQESITGTSPSRSAPKAVLCVSWLSSLDILLFGITERNRNLHIAPETFTSLPKNAEGRPEVPERGYWGFTTCHTGTSKVFMHMKRDVFDTALFWTSDQVALARGLAEIRSRRPILVTANGETVLALPL